MNPHPTRIISADRRWNEDAVETMARVSLAHLLTGLGLGFIAGAAFVGLLATAL